MNTILCYGDSNTWGYNPTTQDRYPRDVRWSGVLQNNLGADFFVIEEGLNGRTTVWDDPIENYKNGKEYLIPCIETHKPIDLVIIFLGTNDLKKRFSLSAYDIAAGAGILIEMVQKSNTGPGDKAPEVLLLAPAPVGILKTVKGVDFAQIFEGAEDKSNKLGQEYKNIADAHKCHFMNTSEIVISSDIDGIHFDENNHRKLGEAIAEYINTYI
jgi:lysophospholipase L1-like esterase